MNATHTETWYRDGNEMRRLFSILVIFKITNCLPGSRIQLPEFLGKCLQWNITCISLEEKNDQSLSTKRFRFIYSNTHYWCQPAENVKSLFPY